jgi:hypothetical protein
MIREVINPRQAAEGLDLVDSLGEGCSLAERLDRLEGARQALDRTPNFTAYFIGYPDGQMFFVALARDAGGRPWSGLPTAASPLVEEISGDRVPRGCSPWQWQVRCSCCPAASIPSSGPGTSRRCPVRRWCSPPCCGSPLASDSA